MSTYKFDIKRIDLSIRKPLVLGPGLVIDKIPYYCVRFSDDKIYGIGWGCSSPLWGGLKHLPLSEGIAKVEEWLLEFAPIILAELEKSDNLARDIRVIHELFYDNERPSANGETIPPLIRGMILAPLEGAVCDYLAKKEGSSMVNFLARHVVRDREIFTKPKYESLCPFLTISGNSTVEEVQEILAKFKIRPVVKFKIGTKGDPVAEAEFINLLFEKILPKQTQMVIDNNQAYYPEQCSMFLRKLKDENNLSRLLFIEQPFKREEEPKDFDRMFDGIDANIHIALDESVGSVADLERIAPLVSSSYRMHNNLIFIPKIEKGGWIEVVRMLEKARGLSIQVSPSTLTGPPPQIPQYWEMFRQVAGVVGIPGVPEGFGMEANGYEILNWKWAVGNLIADEEQNAPIFREDNAMLRANKEFKTPWPTESTTKNLAEIPWTGEYSF